MDKKVVIIGLGPAGVSAALYTVRAGIHTTIIGLNSSALLKTDKIENFYGFEHPISGKDLTESGIRQAKRLGVNIVSEQVIGAAYGDDGTLKITTADNVYDANAVIFATGSSRKTPQIPGIAEFEGSGVSYCAVCDGFFYRGKDVAVLGSGEYALHECKELLPVAKSVTLLTNGEPPTTDVPDEIGVNTDKITALEGFKQLQSVKLENGETLSVAGLFVAVGVASSGDLAKKLGAQTEGTRIVVNHRMETNVPGLYAAGDCVGGLMQIAKAVSDGAIAGTEAVKYLRR